MKRRGDQGTRPPIGVGTMSGWHWELGEEHQGSCALRIYWKDATHSSIGVADAASKVTEQEWREKAKKDLEEWNQRQSEQVEKNKINNR